MNNPKPIPSVKSGDMRDIEYEEFKAWNGNALYYLLEVLNGEKSIETLKEDLLSFRNSTYYTGTNDTYKQIYDKT